ncbi:hypothetical protein CDAR_17481 [Caerostris darwini]|uniref:Uncharacterized protein n=1 Tax=Caerostris darwini TaxID=1538125 RepID=A0AAV4VEF5_9ARAC|nr:hypothetical protein CDAR_17481 [Caerostris darwini]
MTPIPKFLRFVLLRFASRLQICKNRFKSLTRNSEKLHFGKGNPSTAIFHVTDDSFMTPFHKGAKGERNALRDNVLLSARDIKQGCPCNMCRYEFRRYALQPFGEIDIGMFL